MPTERQILYRYDRTDPAKAYEQAQVGNLAHTIEELGDLADFLGA